MKQYYLYGAGINCVGVIKFFGAENIVAVIDSDEEKQGRDVEGIEIISLQQYIEQNHGEEIIITGFFASNAIAGFLEEQGIHNYYKSPYMQSGFYEDSRDIVYRLNLDQYVGIVCCTRNPISELVEKELQKEGKKIAFQYIEEDHLAESDPDIPILVTNEEDDSIWRKLNNAHELKNVLDINKIYRNKYSYKNNNVIKFKDIHKGKRCFVIGNGPSLTYTDLERLHQHGEICFGANRIYLSYEYTNWRPDYYIAVDYTIVKNDCSKIMNLPGTKFIRHFYKMAEEWNKEDIYEFGGLIYKPGEPQLSQDMYEGIYIGNTVIYDAIQIALYMGFLEIYLLGVDMTSGIRAQDEGAHFYKSPDTKENLGKGDIPEIKKCFSYAAKEMEKKGKILRNATRGGELDNIIRVDFDSLF